MGRAQSPANSQCEFYNDVVEFSNGSGSYCSTSKYCNDTVSCLPQGIMCVREYSDVLHFITEFYRVVGKDCILSSDTQC